MTTIRLASFNLLSGRSLTDGSIEVARLVAAVQRLEVDLLAIQEVDRGQPRSGWIDQTAVVARALGAVDHRFVAAVDGTPGEPGWTPTPPEAGGTAWPIETDDLVDPAITPVGPPQFGVGLISRLPVERWQVLRLRPARGRFPIPIPSRPPQVLWLNDEPRVVVAAVLAQPQLTVACTHLSFVPPSTVRQLRIARRWLAALPGPQVLMGDLNLPTALARRITGWTPLVSAPTFPSPTPRLQLDHVLATGLPVGFRASGRVLQMPISDHRAVVVDLELPAPGTDPGAEVHEQDRRPTAG